jgi:hypothetical protein
MREEIRKMVEYYSKMIDTAANWLSKISKITDEIIK